MRDWKDDDPKAGLLARKQAAILAAARKEFLDKGFGGTTMAGVAEAAGVSVATLYRHARSKEDLFEAIVTHRHDPDEVAAGLAMLAALPLADALVAFGEGVLGMMISPAVVAMYRMVIAEAERFPELGAVIFERLVGHVTETLVGFLTPRVGAARATEIAPEFMSRLLGDRLLRSLLGMPPVDEAGPERTARLKRLVTDLVREAVAAP